MPPATPSAVELNQLSKSFRVRRARGTGVGARVRDFFSRDTQTVPAVDRLSFSIAPGEIELTRTPCGPYSRAIARARPSTPALAAE